MYFDETTTQQVKKQMDIHIAYWSPSFKKVIGLDIDSTFVVHAAAENLKHNLNAHMLLQCSMDGFAVNMSYLNKFTIHQQAVFFDI